MTLALRRLEPAAPEVERATLLIDSVSRGPLVINVRAPGTLTPERTVYVSAVVPGRVEKLPLRPGAMVEPGTLIAQLTNPDLQLQLLEAQRNVSDAEAQLLTLQSTLEQQRLQQQSAVQQAITQYHEAERNATALRAMSAKNLAAPNEVKTAEEQAEELKGRVEIEKQRLDVLENSIKAQIAHQERTIAQMREILKYNQERLDALNVRAGEAGVLQSLEPDFGVYVNSGEMIARIAQPSNLKAVLRVPENQAKDIAQGQKAEIDTRNGIVPGHVMRIDPIANGGTVTVEVALDGKLPEGARAEMSVDGTIEITRLPNVLQTGRPSYGQPESSVGLFKLDPDGEHASRVTVQLGRASVSQIEIRGGLQEGDRVIVSDMSQYDNTNRVRIK
ncbi:MAG TPA: efflux RND transporter periplasmic adaptor subunit [Gemmatimonadaceae bacterium]|nr:efflux RND transporter periplasmic adaptor subunit [Gemmatimonadaceae bacterium]